MCPAIDVIDDCPAIHCHGRLFLVPILYALNAVFIANDGVQHVNHHGFAVFTAEDTLEPYIRERVDKRSFHNELLFMSDLIVYAKIVHF